MDWITEETQTDGSCIVILAKDLLRLSQSLLLVRPRLDLVSYQLLVIRQAICHIYSGIRCGISYIAAR